MNGRSGIQRLYWGTPEWIIAGWLFLNLAQGIFTELFHDEAYYWVLSRRPQLGYAEHAPGMMILIWLSSWIPGELGVRLFPILMNSVGIWVLYRLVNPNRERSFFLLLFGMAGMHAIAFFAAPDSPLFLLSILFWWAYRRFLIRESLGNALLLSVIIALMLYSKYHGAMVVFFAVLSFPGLWKKRMFYVIVLGSFLLFLPHLWWLWQDGFGTFVFHLGDRNPGAWYPGRTLEFFLAYLLITGPLLAVILIPSAAQRRPVDQFEKSLKWVWLGVTAFLILLTFNSRVEGNWAATAMIPLFILGYRQLESDPIRLRWGVRLALPTLVLVLVVRSYLIWDFLPGKWEYRNEFHGWDTWARTLKEKAEGRPVLFVNWYQYPSKYAFYSGEEPLGLSNAYYHPTQISEWTEEAQLQHREVMIMSTNHFQFADTLFDSPTGFYYTVEDSFRSFGDIHIDCVDLHWAKNGQDSLFDVILTQEADTSIHIRREEDVRIIGILFEGNTQVMRVIQEPTLDVVLEPGKPVNVSYGNRMLDKIPSGTYRFAIGLAVGELLLTRNSDWLEVTVEE